MKRVLWVAAFLGVSTVFTAGQSGPAVAVRLRFAKNHYSIRDRIELEIVRESISNDPLLLSSLWFWGVMRTDIHVFDKARHEIRTGVLADSVPYPPKPYDFVVLGPTFLGIPSLSDEQVTSFPPNAGPGWPGSTLSWRRTWVEFAEQQ